MSHRRRTLSGMDAATVRERVGAHLRDAEIQAAYLFGSRSTGGARDSSDVDIAVLVGRPFGLLDEQRLAARAQSTLHLPVDIVVLDRASLELRGRVVQEGELIYSGDHAARVTFEVRTRSQYLDFLPTLREHTRRYLEHTARADG